MKQEILIPENSREFSLLMDDFKQFLPFYSSQQEAQRSFLKKLTTFNQTEDNQICFRKNGKACGLINYTTKNEQVIVTDFLLSLTELNEHTSLKFWVGKFEKIAKKCGVKEVCFTILSLNPLFKEKLKSLGYVVKEEPGIFIVKKSLSYHTGLVLAGGGARGAYQIGAWRALRELGISYEIISGTSVGALNGALMLQDDFSQGETMWHEIETQKILSYPHVSEGGSFSVKQTLKEMQLLAQSAFQSQGVSTQPLAELIARLIDEEKMQQASADLYICTTEAPSMKEVVISMKDVVGTFNQWLLASSSFFPAMAAAKINNHYYVDGGYRNNIPVDVALDKGATELIIVNVKGPGITKSIKVPDHIAQVLVESPWSLGTVLLFDGARSTWNIELGYLETMKAFGHYRGYWYTLDLDFKDESLNKRVKSLWREFAQELTIGEKKLFLNGSNISYLTEKVGPRYGERLTEGGLYIYLLELVAKFLNVKPTVLYDLNSFQSEIRQSVKLIDENVEQSETMLLSLKEWLTRYLGNVPLPTERQQIHYLVNALKSKKDDPLLLNIAKITPLNYLTAKLVLKFEQEEL